MPLLLSAIVLVACDDASESVRVTERYTLDMLGRGVSLTEEKCDSARMGQLLYVGDSSGIYYCTGKAWKTVNGKDGKDGRDGKDGEDGVDGKRGEYGTSGTDCFVEKFAEGFVLGCGATKAVVRYDFDVPDSCSIWLEADSSYMLLCGKDRADIRQGARGDVGEVCKQTDVGGGQVRLVCGQDSVTLFKAACGETPFDPDGSQFCYGDTLVERCGSHIYDIKKQFCYNDSLVNLCGGKAYELKEQFCYNDSLVDLCTGKKYDLSLQFCYSDSLVLRCDGQDYDLKKQFCFNDSLVMLCGGESYDLRKLFCYNNFLVPLCGGESYRLEDQFCYRKNLVDLCGGDSYDPEMQFCHNGTIADFCAGSAYDPNTESCYEGAVVPKCPAELKDNQFCDERNGKVYRFTVIGNAIWMAQNLDYKVPNSFCETGTRDGELYCVDEQIAGRTYKPIGRYYPWSVAMARSEDECGYGHRCPKLSYPHQGVCPNGWHLPDTTEWDALVEEMGVDNHVYWDKSLNMGDDAYGFSVFTTGIIAVSYSKDTKEFTRRDKANPLSADIWSSTQYSNNNAFLYFLYTNGDRNWQVTKINYGKSVFARTVRCVKN